MDAVALPGHLRFGPDRSGELVELLDADPVAGASKRPLLLLGNASRGAAWAQDLGLRLRRRFGAALAVQVRQGDMLTVEEADRLAGQARHHAPDLVIGVGGGSVLDAAKVVAALAGTPAGVAAAAADHALIGAVVPVVAVPTTPGSGSEATPTATVWDRAARRKLALDDPRLRPCLAVVDPLLGRTLPSRSLAAAALDALAHGVESAWSTRSTPDSRAHALACVRLVSANLPGCLADRADRDALSAVSLGATHGGVAIATTRTTLAHALSYPLTARHGLSHGHACALMLGPVAGFNAGVTAADCDDPRGADFVHAAVASVLAAMAVGSAPELGHRLAELCRAAELATLDELGAAVDLPAVVEEARTYDRSGNNPRRLDPAVLLALTDHRQRT
jgi:phosphonoacetaldehyde reductase